MRPFGEGRSGALAVIALALIFLVSRGVGPAAAEVSVVVSIVPQKTFVEKIGGDRVAVTVMVPPGASPATYEPKPKQMATLAEADLYFSMGVPFERAWLPRMRGANPKMRVVPMHEGIEPMPMVAHHHHDEHDEEAGQEHAQDRGEEAEHGDEHGHGHGLDDPHMWVSPPLVRLMADNILDALSRIDPENAGAYAENHLRFVREINALDTRICEIFAGGPRERREFMVFHPAWGYFAKAYGLEQVAVEVEGKEPGPRELAGLIEHAREHDIKVIFVQPEFSQKSARLIAESIGGKVVAVTALAPDWAGNLVRVAEAIAAGLRQE